MITEKKRTPITWWGKDGWEILMEDDFPFEDDVCELCMYREWNDWEDCGVSCGIIHGCGVGQKTYFIFKPS